MDNQKLSARVEALEGRPDNTLAMDNRSTYMSFKEGRQRMVVKEGVGG